MAVALHSMGEDEVVVPGEGWGGFGALETSRGVLPLAGLEVRGRVTGLLAETRLRQRFVNGFEEPLEATYVFPLPARAAVTRFRLMVAGRVIEGELKERGQARREYGEAVRQGHRAAIAEEERPEIFTLRVGNLPPGEEAVVELTMVAPLQVDAGEATFRFPLVVAPRYIPGTPLGGQGGGPWGRRGHRRGTRCLADQPAGPATGLPQPGAPGHRGGGRQSGAADAGPAK